MVISAKKRRRVRKLLASPAWRMRSTNWIARVAGVSWRYADKVREQLGGRPMKVESINGRRVASRRKRPGGY